MLTDILISMKLLEKHESQIHESLHEWAAEHTKSHERLVLLDINPDKYPHQRILNHTVQGTPLEPLAIDSVAQNIDNRYSELAQAVEKNHKSLRIAKAIIDSQQNLILGTDHQELVDIALIMANITSRLRQKGANLDSGLIANKMAAYLGVEMHSGEIIPATNVLSLAFNETYLTLPSTISSKDKLSLPRRVISAYNGRVIDRGIINRLRATSRIGKAMLLGVALSGTINKRLNMDEYNQSQHLIRIEPEQQQATLIIGRANIGTLKFMKRALTMVAGSQLQPDNTRVDISDEPLYISTKEELSNAMNSIATIRNHQDTSHHYVYDMNGNLPVIRTT